MSTRSISKISNDRATSTFANSEISVYGDLVKQHDMSANEVFEGPTPYTAGQRLALVVAKVRPEEYAQYLRQLISFDTVPLVLQNLPLDLSQDDTIFNAIVRTQHKLIFNEDWSENLTELVKEYYLCKTEAIDRTVQELAKPLK
jgi:hypothetical protein